MPMTPEERAYVDAVAKMAAVALDGEYYMPAQRAAPVPDIEQAAIEFWRLTINDGGVERDWDRVPDYRKTVYRQHAVAILSAAGCINGLMKAGPKG